MNQEEINLEEIEKILGNKIDKFKISVGTIRRLIGYLITSLMEIIGTLWGTKILVDNQLIDSIVGILSIIAVIAYIIFNGYLYWKNNSISKEAIKAEKILNLFKSSR